MKFLKSKVSGLRDKAYGLLPYVAKAMGAITVWTRKIAGWLVLVGPFAILIEIICRQWSQIIPTVAAIVASLAFSEAQKMRKSFKAWGFESGPGDVNSNA